MVDVKCDICGKENKIAYRDYMKNCKNNDGHYVCQPCSVQVKHNKTLDARRADYIKRLKEKCKENGYKLISTEDEITCNTSKIRYECPIHGEQSMRVSNFLTGRKCPQCKIDISKERNRMSESGVVHMVSACGGKILNPEEYKNNSTHNLKFICNECGSVFTSSLQKYIQHGGQVCRKCSGRISLGEIKIKHFLDDSNICYEYQKWFSDCRDINPLPFDFYLPEYNTIIEFDGRQHFEETHWFSYSFEKTRKHDSIKNTYCLDNGIRLIRISYKNINHIDDIIKEQILT